MDHSDYIKELHFCFHTAQRERFTNGDLAARWLDRYPELFDRDDLRCARAQPGYHFYEWLAAVLLYEATGYLSLVEKFDAAAHDRKIKKFKELVPTSVFDLIVTPPRKGTPDLFVYRENGSDWHFGEAKGASDRLHANQLAKFQQLFELTGKRVTVINLRETNL